MRMSQTREGKKQQNHWKKLHPPSRWCLRSLECCMCRVEKKSTSKKTTSIILTVYCYKTAYDEEKAYMPWKKKRFDSLLCVRADLHYYPDDNKGVKKDRTDEECSFIFFRLIWLSKKCITSFFNKQNIYIEPWK